MNTRTNIVLDDTLVQAAMQRAGVSTKKEAVDAALRAFVRRPDYSGWLALRGSGVLIDGYTGDDASAIGLPVGGLSIAEPSLVPRKVTTNPSTRKPPSRRTTARTGQRRT